MVYDFIYPDLSKDEKLKLKKNSIKDNDNNFLNKKNNSLKSFFSKNTNNWVSKNINDSVSLNYKKSNNNSVD